MEERTATAAPASSASARGYPLLVAAYLCSMIFPITFHVGPIALMPFRAVLLVAFIPMAIGFFLTSPVKLRAFDWMIIGWMAWSLLALLVEHGPLIIEFAASNLVEILGAWMLGRLGVRSAADMQRLTRIMFWLVVFLLPFAAIESVTGRRLWAELVPGWMDFLETSARWGLNRANVAFTHPIIYGVFVSSIVGLIWYTYGWRKRPVTRTIQVMVVLASTFLSLSSGALVSFAVQAGLIGWDMVLRFVRHRWKILAWLIAIGYVVLDLLSNRTPFHLVMDYATFDSGSAYNRILIYRFGMDNVWANPFFGIGLSDWERPPWMGDSVDNFWLLNAMRYGLPAFLMLIVGIFLLMRAVMRAPITDPAERACRLGWAISVTGLIIAAGTVHYWTVALSFFIFLIGAGGWLADRRSVMRARQPMPESTAPKGPRKGQL